MSVAEVRRGLDAVRTKWNQQPARFYFTEKLFNGMSIQQFCTAFTLGHHTKRHAKSKTGARSAAEVPAADTKKTKRKQSPSSAMLTRARSLRRKKT